MFNRARYNEAREALGLTHQQVADQVRVDRVSIHRWLSGSARPTLDHLVRLGQVLQIDWRELVDG